MADDFDPIIDEMKNEMGSQTVKRNLTVAQDVNPDKQADLMKLSRKSGIPAMSIATPDNESWVKNQTRVKDLDPDNMVKTHPMTSRALTDENFAKIAHDDVENLRNLEDSFSVIGKTTSSTLDELLANSEKQAAYAGYLMLAYGPEGQDVDAMAQFIAGRNRPLADVQARAPQYQRRFGERLKQADGFLADAGVIMTSPRAVGRGIVTNLPNMVLPSITAMGGAKVGSGVGAGIGTGVATILGQAGPQVALPEEIATVPVGAAVGATVGGMVGGVAGGFAGGSLVEIAAWMDQELSKANVDVTDAGAIATAFRNPEFVEKIKARAEAKGLTTAGIDALWNATFAGRFAKGLKPLDSLSTLGTNTGKVAQDVGVGAVGESVSEAGGQLAATGEVDSGEVLLEGFSSLGQSVFDTSMYSKIRKGDVDQAAQTIAGQKQAEIAGLHDAAAAVKTIQRDAGAVRAMVEAQNPDAKVYVDGAVAAKYFQELDADSQKSLEEVIPDIRDRLSEAQASGSDVMLNRSDYVAYIAGTENGRVLVDHVKFTVDDMTVAQLTDPDYLESLYGLTPEQSQETDEIDAFQERLVNELMDSGRIGSQELARASVSPLVSLARTMQERGGSEAVTKELLEGIEVQGEKPMPRAQVDFTDKQINDMREYAARVASIHKARETRRSNDEAKAKAAGKEYKPAKARGKSRHLPVLKYLAERGVLTGSRLAGELKAMDVTPKTAPWLFVKQDKTIATAGGVQTIKAYKDLDNLDSEDLNFAVGADVFENIGTSVSDMDGNYADPWQILEAIDNEVRGNPVVELPSDPQEAQFEDFTRYLEEMGLDLDTATNDQVKQALKNPADFMGEETVTPGETPSDRKIFFQSKTETPEFKAWFGDSKVVDADGKPLVVYHGTNAEFEAFIPSPNGVFGPGAYFTKYDGDAATYGKKVLPVYLSIQNPLNMSMGDFRRLRSEGVNISQWAEDRKAEGFDGVVTDDMSVIVAFRPEQIKSVNNRGTFDANDARILYQDNTFKNDPNAPADHLVSALVTAAQDMKQAKGSGEQMLGILKNTAGVKEEEIAWTGLDEFLKGKKSVTKDEISAYLQDNQVKIEEVTLGNNAEDTGGMWVEADPTSDTYSVLTMDESGDPTVVSQGHDTEDEAEQSLAKERNAETKFSQYTLPGGENYREVLLTLPNVDAERLKEVKRKLGLGRDEVSDEEFKSLVEEEKTLKATDEAYRSSHFDQPNILAHVRLNDRTDADGKRVLFVEEIQSDWHQAGRKKGYKGEGQKHLKSREVFYRAEIEKNPELITFSDDKRKDGSLNGLTRAQYKDGITAFGRSSKEAMHSLIHHLAKKDTEEKGFKPYEHQQENMVPDAPFKKTWHEMAFRRVAQMAAQQGYDRIAWTTGEQQNERFDLSKQVDQIVYFPNEDGTVDIQVVKDGNVVQRQNGIDSAKAEDLVGKDVAKRIFDGEGDQEGEGKSLSGLQLSVGGSGMKGFYDKIIPDYAKKFGKKFGASVAKTEIDTGRVEKKKPDWTTVDNSNVPDVEGIVSVHSMDITPEMREAAKVGLSLFQGEGTGPRGSVSFMKDGRYVIQLFNTSDLSTFLHETGHVFLDAYSRYAAADGVTEQIATDMNTILDYLGVKTYEEVQTEQHEKFARAFENYLMSGEAPSVGLQAVFQKFKAWLTRIYQVATGLNAPVTPELKAVFDRMLATDEEISQVAGNEGFNLNQDLLSILSKPDQERYQKLNERALEQAKERLLKRTLKQKERETTEAWRTERAKLREQFEEEVNRDPVYRAMQFLTKGVFLPGDDLLPPPPMKINRADAQRILGKTIMRKLPSTMFSKEGIAADDMAEMMAYGVGNPEDGFRTGTGSELLFAIANAEDRKARIKRLADEEMVNRHGDLLVDGTIEAAALEAYHTDAQALKLEMEGKAAAKLAGVKFGSNTNFELAAQKVLSTQKVQDAANADRYYRGAIRAAKAYGRAIKGKDYATAVKAKQQQLLSHHLYKQSIQARKTLDKSFKAWNRLKKDDEALTKSMDVNYLYVARAILGRYGVLPYNPGNLQTFFNNIRNEDPEAFQDLLLAVEQNTQNVPQAETRDVTYKNGKLAGQTITQTKQPWTKLTYEEFLGLKDSVDNVLGVGRKQKTMTIEGKQVERGLIIEELEGRIAGIPATSIADGSTKALEWHDKGKLALSGVRAGMRRVESWAQTMDGVYGGVFRKYIWNPVNDARGQYLEAKHEYLDKMVALLKPNDERLNGSGKIVGYEVGYTFHSKAELVGALLHMGNESNWYKLWKGGRGKGSWNPANLQAMFERMTDDGTITKEDMDLVQAMWDLVNELKPQAQKAHKAMYGYYFSEITAWPIETPWGTYKGGYWPAIADQNLSQDSRIRQDQENLITVNNSAMFPTTGRGFTKDRNENYAAPLAFDLRLLPGHVDKVLRFVHLEPAIKDVARLVNDKGFRKSLEVVDPRAAEDMLIPWLQRAARQTVETNDSKWFKYTDPAARWLRSSASAQAMMLNMLNAIQQITGFGPAIYKVGARPMGRALVQYMKNPAKAHEKMNEASAFMRYRNTILADNLQKNVLDVTLNRSKFSKVRDAAQAHGYIFQQVMQSWVDGTTWMAAYDDALVKGMNEKQSVRYADAIIRETQGSTDATDLSKFEAGPATMRLFTMFYSYFNTQANLITTEAQNLARAANGDKMGVAKGLGYLYLMAYAVPSFMAEMLVKGLKGDLPDDEDDDGSELDEWLKWFFGSQLRYGTAMVPWVGQVINGTVNAFDDKPYNDRISISPVIQMGETLARTPKNIYEAAIGEGDASRAVQDTLTSMGFLTGLPLGQLGKPLGYAADVAEGDAEIDSLIDPLQGIIAGPPPAGGR